VAGAVGEGADAAPPRSRNSAWSPATVGAGKRRAQTGRLRRRGRRGLRAARVGRDRGPRAAPGQEGDCPRTRARV